MPKKRFCELAQQLGIIDWNQFDEALRKQETSMPKHKIGFILFDLGHITWQDIVDILRLQTPDLTEKHFRAIIKKELSGLVQGLPADEDEAEDNAEPTKTRIDVNVSIVAMPSGETIHSFELFRHDGESDEELAERVSEELRIKLLEVLEAARPTADVLAIKILEYDTPEGTFQDLLDIQDPSHHHTQVFPPAPEDKPDEESQNGN
jgi:nucleotidyltransferase/DNA polymerase involved in DNA repair